MIYKKNNNDTDTTLENNNDTSSQSTEVDSSVKKYFDDTETSYSKEDKTKQKADKIKEQEGFDEIYSCPMDHSGTEAYIKAWITQDSKFPPIVMVLDIGEEVKKYIKLINSLKSSGFSIFCTDIRGHGYLAKDAFHIENFSNLVNDLLQVVAWAKYKTNSILSPVVLGEGFGALVSIYFAKIYPSYCSGIILSSPTMDFPIRITRFKRVLLKVLSKFFPLMKTKVLFFDNKRLKKYIDALDPKDSEDFLVKKSFFENISVKFLDELVQANLDSFDSFQNIRSDILILKPMEDRMNDVVAFMTEEHIGKNRITIKNFDTSYKLSLYSDIEEIINVILDWIGPIVEKKDQ